MTTPEVQPVDVEALRKLYDPAVYYVAPSDGRGVTESQAARLNAFPALLDEIERLRARVALAESSAPDIFDAAVKEQRKRRVLEHEVEELRVIQAGLVAVLDGLVEDAGSVLRLNKDVVGEHAIKDRCARAVVVLEKARGGR